MKTKPRIRKSTSPGSAGNRPGAAAPSSTASQPNEVRLAKALWLGYLKTDRPDDPLITEYLSHCHEHDLPAVVLYLHRRRAAIDYRFPSPDCRLTGQATECIRLWAANLVIPGARRPSVITPAGGEITDLRLDRAEELAFRIADASRL